MADSSTLSEPTDGAGVDLGLDPGAVAGVSGGIGPDGSVGADGPGGVGEGRVDGRRARRERNREAVVDAVLELLREGHLRPSTDQIAERAGLSPRSLFRYFDDVDDLFGVAIQKQARFFREHLHAEIDPTRPLRERIVSFVEHRLDLYDAISGVGVVARANEPFRPQVRAELTQFRALMRDQLRTLVADDPAELAADIAEQRLAAAEMLASFESYRMLLDDRGLDRTGAAGVMVEGLATLLATR